MDAVVLRRLAELKAELRDLYLQLRGPLVGNLPLLCFRVRQDHYAIHFGVVDRVVWIARLTPVAQAPPHLAGLLNLAGDTVSVIDLGRLFHQKDTVWKRYTPVIVLAWSDRRLGLIADELDEIEQLNVEPPDPLLPLPDLVAAYFAGPPARLVLDHASLADSLNG